VPAHETWKRVRSGVVPILSATRPPSPPGEVITASALLTIVGLTLLVFRSRAASFYEQIMSTKSGHLSRHARLIVFMCSTVGPIAMAAGGIGGMVAGFAR
jgi:hypothetical protein